ncbi:MAG: S8 family serine peptidase, partial [Bacteroidota bacterium]
ADINEGTLNFTAQLIDDGTIYDDGTFDPLPFCDDSHNSRLIGIDQSGAWGQDRIKVVIIDQPISGIDHAPLYSTPDEIGGAHGNKVYSVINNLLTQAGLTEVEYISLVLFDDQGQSSLASLTGAFSFIKHRFDIGIWDINHDRVLVNLSANVAFPDEIDLREVISGGISEQWEECLGDGVTPGNYPVMLINSAGNHSGTSASIFPAAWGFTSEISVAGTENCFSTPWENTNHDPIEYEIAAEAESVLTEDDGLYYISNGTSFSSAEVTAVAAQIALNRIGENIHQIQGHVLNAVDHVPALASTVEYGRVVNIENHFWHAQGGKLFTQVLDESPSLTLQTNPNPFSQNAIVNIGVEVGQ